MPSAYQDPPEFRGSYGGGGIAMPSLTPVTRMLLYVNGGLFLLFALLVNWAGAPGRAIYEFFALVPHQWREWFPFVPFWQLLTYGFLHSTHSLMHIFYNLLGLYFFGTMLEGLIGSRRFLWIYLAAVVLGGLVQLVVTFATGEVVMIAGQTISVSTVGASGGVLCVIVASAVLRPDARVIFIFVPMTLRTLAILMVALDVLPLLLRSGGNTARWVHLAGAAWGFLAVKQGWIWLDPLEVLAERRARSQVEAREADSERLDRLLQQINESGINSLSRRDREFLKRVSSRR